MAETPPPHPTPLPPPVDHGVTLPGILAAARALADAVLRHEEQGNLHTRASALNWMLDHPPATQPIPREPLDWPVILIIVLVGAVVIGGILAGVAGLIR